ncbi:MAG: arsenite efflux MFS transporter ArsK [Devosia sp.]
MSETAHPVPARLIWALGLTQTVGYGTLYYSFGPLAPQLAQSFGWPEATLFGVLVGSLLLGGLVSPLAGSLADRFGAGRVMGFGSLAAAVTLVLCGLAGNGIMFCLALLCLELAAAFVLYPVAFAALAQMSGAAAQRQIVHVTLIAGFASTVFWPITTALAQGLGWRGAYLVFAGLNLLVCAPIHLGLARHAKANHRQRGARPIVPGRATAHNARKLLLLMVGGFALSGMLSAAVLMHMIPMLEALGLGSASVAVATLFGPAQVVSRVTNMGLGARLPQPVLAVMAAGLMPLGVLVLVLSAPSPIGAGAFAILFGFGSGLSSIVGGTLPLMLFGNQGYGRRAGLINAGRQFAAALAPFLFALLAATLGSRTALATLCAVGGLAVLAFASIAWQMRVAATVCERPIGQSL